MPQNRDLQRLCDQTRQGTLGLKGTVQLVVNAPSLRVLTKFIEVVSFDRNESPDGGVFAAAETANSLIGYRRLFISREKTC